MDTHIRAYAWIHFAASARNTSSHAQQAAVADELLAEFDKRNFSVEPTREQLEEELEVVRKAQQFEEVVSLTLGVALPGETITGVVDRLVKATL